MSAARVDLPTGVRRFSRSDPCLPRRRPRTTPVGSTFPATLSGGTRPLRRATQRRFVLDHLEVDAYRLLCDNLADGGSTGAFQAWVGFAYQRSARAQASDQFLGQVRRAAASSRRACAVLTGFLAPSVALAFEFSLPCFASGGGSRRPRSIFAGASAWRRATLCCRRHSASRRTVCRAFAFRGTLVGHTSVFCPTRPRFIGARGLMLFAPCPDLKTSRAPPTPSLLYGPA